MNKINSINNKNSNIKLNKIGEIDFFKKKHKTKTDDDNYSKKENKKEIKSEKKIYNPNSKNSCFEIISYKISQNKINDSFSGRRRMSVNCMNGFVQRKSIIKFEENKRYSKKERKRKKTEEFCNIYNSKNIERNEEQNIKTFNTTTNKENLRKSTKIRKNKNNEKDKEKNNEKNIDFNTRKDSNKSFHKTPNKKFRHLASHNYDTVKKISNIEKNLNLDMKKKNSEKSNTNTPKNLNPKKTTFASNRNLTHIKITSQAVDNKDIHLEMNGKQETIINYTNQEMVNDEMEYMAECLKVLKKLDLSKQPRCRSKVDFNWGNSSKKKNSTF